MSVARPQINIPPEASLRPLCERLAIRPPREPARRRVYLVGRFVGVVVQPDCFVQAIEQDVAPVRVRGRAVDADDLSDGDVASIDMLHESRLRYMHTTAAHVDWDPAPQREHRQLLSGVGRRLSGRGAPVVLAGCSKRASLNRAQRSSVPWRDMTRCSSEAVVCRHALLMNLDTL